VASCLAIFQLMPTCLTRTGPSWSFLRKKILSPLLWIARRKYHQNKMWNPFLLVESLSVSGGSTLFSYSFWGFVYCRKNAEKRREGCACVEPGILFVLSSKCSSPFLVWNKTTTKEGRNFLKRKPRAFRFCNEHQTVTFGWRLTCFLRKTQKETRGKRGTLMFLNEYRKKGGVSFLKKKKRKC
jgi:hypothetical protein